MPSYLTDFNFIQRAVEFIPDILFVLDLNTHEVLYSNRAVATTLGYSLQQIREMQHPIYDIMHKDDIDHMRRHVEEMKSLDDNVTVETTFRLVDVHGGIRWFKDRNVVFKRDERNVPIEKLGMSREVTENKMFQLQLSKANQTIEALNESLIEKNRSLEIANSELKTFNAVIAHDFRESLKKVYTSFEYLIMHDSKALSNEGRANIRRGQSAVQKMKLVADDITEYSDVLTNGTGKERVALMDVFDDLKRSYGEKLANENVTITTNVSTELVAHPVLVRLLFRNLITNAIRHRKDGEKLEIVVNCHPLDGERVAGSLDKSTNYCVVHIEDNGNGFESEHIPDLFEVFHKLDEKDRRRRVGINLAICRKVMELHNGHISVESQPGKGAKFSCYFPMK